MNVTKSLKNQKGFTLIEIISVLVLLGILAAVAIPKYMDLSASARQKAAQGQMAEVKGRLSNALGAYMLANNGQSPADGAALVTYLNGVTTDACPTTEKEEGDFHFKCEGKATKTVTITITQIKGTATGLAASDFTF